MRTQILDLLKVAAEIARNIVVLATVAVGAVVLVIKDIWTTVAEHSVGLRLAALASALILLVAAAFLYWYAARVNRRRMSIVRCLASNDAKRARQLWGGSRVRDAKRLRRVAHGRSHNRFGRCPGLGHYAGSSSHPLTHCQGHALAVQDRAALSAGCRKGAVAVAAVWRCLSGGGLTHPAGCGRAPRRQMHALSSALLVSAALSR